MCVCVWVGWGGGGGTWTIRGGTYQNSHPTKVSAEHLHQVYQAGKMKNMAFAAHKRVSSVICQSLASFVKR